MSYFAYIGAVGRPFIDYILASFMCRDPSSVAHSRINIR